MPIKNVKDIAVTLVMSRPETMTFRITFLTQPKWRTSIDLEGSSMAPLLSLSCMDNISSYDHDDDRKNCCETNILHKTHTTRSSSGECKFAMGTRSKAQKIYKRVKITSKNQQTFLNSCRSSELSKFQ